MMAEEAFVPARRRSEMSSHHPNGLRIVVRGPLSDPSDRSALAELRSALTRAADAGECHFILDLAAIPYVDSAALGMFVDLLRRVRGDGGTISVTGACPAVRRVFEITCLARIFGMTGAVPKNSPVS